ncbi:sigma factor-like helix-turn-helix DNA-binding protein [Brachyspira intermedia]|uniref:sigma factor-like helix-turn-helix DNA-binding protein n=1 Tax=Brachyspira intermedia TaxID=84377 RepID=UPI003004C566
MKENTNTCNLCCKRDQCKELCDDMKKAISNKKSNNDIYSDATFNVCETDISKVIYTFGLSKVEDRDSKRIIIALLKKDQREMLELLSKGYTQKEIAEKLEMSQSNVSQKLNNIKKELQDSMIKIMPYIL